LAVLTATRPRRHPNLLTFIIVAALLLVLAAGVFAAVHYFFVEGTLQFDDTYWSGDPALEEGLSLSTHFLSGELEWSTEFSGWPSSSRGDMSTVTGNLVFWRWDTWPPTRSDILASNPDWSHEVNLTEIAGIGGINCGPFWSPDETMIVFQHCDPVEGLLPCKAGFHMWVMNADGSDAHQVMPEGGLPTSSGSWSPDGSRLLAWMGEWYGDGERVGVISTDIWGTNIRVLPNVGAGASWSPDGRMIISGYAKKGQLEGQDGWWNQLLLTNADGSDPRVLVEQFIGEADIRAQYPKEDQLKWVDDVDYWVEDVRHWAGPCETIWSPSGDKIAFLAALPFDPDGPWYIAQIEVWVYDLTTDELIRVTNDDVGQASLSWK
ncbi:MAG: hypothetical protein JSW71_06350, partial [Gemmatimonadota bacterium]